MRQGNHEIGIDAPYDGAKQELGSARLRLVDKAPALPKVFTEYRLLRQRRRADRAVDLAACGRVLVGQERLQSCLGAVRGGCESCGSPAYDHDVPLDLKRFRLHRPMLRLPRPVTTSMPSRTGTRQACRLATPSTVTRQSKQTPIMQ